MDNMFIYNAGRSVPTGAVKKINAGAYGKAGLSDINPQWRIEKMTEIFGPCGDGWIWEPVDVWVSENVCYAHIKVQYMTESGEYSHPIHGYGGTVMGRMSDDSDVYKSTLTDAVSNALRYIGIGADVWYKPGRDATSNQFDTKYSAPPPTEQRDDLATPEQVATINMIFPPERIKAMCKHYRVADVANISQAQATMAIKSRRREIEKAEAAQAPSIEGVYEASLNGD